MCAFLGAKKMSGQNLSSIIFGEPAPEEDLADFLIRNFTTIKKFDDFLKVLTFYHVESCEHDECLQYYFAVNLRYAFTEHTVQNKENAKELRNYCRMRKEQFIRYRIFIHRLAELEKQRIKLQKIFRETLSIWNNTKN